MHRTLFSKFGLFERFDVLGSESSDFDLAKYLLRYLESSAYSKFETFGFGPTLHIK